MALYCSPGQVDLISENSQMDSACGGPLLMPKSSHPVDSVQSSFTLRACSSSVCVHLFKQMMQPFALEIMGYLTIKWKPGMCSPACDPSLGHVHKIEMPES